MGKPKLTLLHNNSEWAFIALTTVRAPLPGTHRTVKILPGLPIPEAITFGPAWNQIIRMVRTDSDEFAKALALEKTHKEENEMYLTSGERYHSCPLNYRDDIYPVSCRAMPEGVFIDEGGKDEDPEVLGICENCKKETTEESDCHSDSECATLCEECMQDLVAEESNTTDEDTTDEDTTDAESEADDSTDLEPSNESSDEDSVESTEEEEKAEETASKSVKKKRTRKAKK